MKFELVPSLSKATSCDALVLPFWKRNKKIELAISSSAFNKQLAAVLKAPDFQAEPGDFLIHYVTGKFKRLILLGLGEEEHASAQVIRKAYGEVVKACRRKDLSSLAVILPEVEKVAESDCICKAVSEGLLLANYSFTHRKASKPEGNWKASLTKIALIGVDNEMKSICQNTRKTIDGVNLARDLVNGNADDITPQKIASEAKQLASEYNKLKVTVFDRKRIEKEGMHLLLAVNRGALHDPTFSILEYKGNPKSKDMTVIVGKGITYDTGGINLKPTGYLETMKSDMAGSAAILGTMKAVAALDLKVNLCGIIPSTENAIGPQSYKPGDIYSSHGGKTVEIANTDAEGRLVLADALSYAIKEFKPDRVIDLATLTGAIVVALGDEATGLFSNNDQLADQLFAAGVKTHERVWRLPIYKEYRSQIESPIADIKNSGGREAGSITAALFLKEFVGKTPWAHLDIAGTAFFEKPRLYNTTHATGVGVRLLVEFLQGLIV